MRIISTPLASGGSNAGLAAELNAKPGAYTGMIGNVLEKLRDFVADLAPGPEAAARREAEAARLACCQLLLEVARLEPANAVQKRDVAIQAMEEQFGTPEPGLAAMIEAAGRPENRPTSYFDAVRSINGHFDSARKALFIEQLWRVAMVDGDIDMYEDHLVRKLAELLYVSHSDFILARNRVRARTIAPHERCGTPGTFSRTAGETASSG